MDKKSEIPCVDMNTNVEVKQNTFVHTKRKVKAIKRKSSSSKSKIVCVENLAKYGSLSGPCTKSIGLKNISEKPDRFLCRVKMKNKNN